MATPEHPHLAFLRRYLETVGRMAGGAELAAFYTPDVVQEEFPNRLMPLGTRRDLTAILEGAERGQQVVRKQRIEIHNILSSGSTAVAEVTWTGTLGIPMGALAAGDRMTARFCMVIEIEDGRIRAQRNYDCFDPF